MTDLLDQWSVWRGTIRGVMGLRMSPASLLGVLIKRQTKPTEIWDDAPREVYFLDDELMSQVDRAVCALSKRHRRVIKCRFCWGRHLTVKDRTRRLRTSRSEYYRDLADALDEIGHSVHI